MRGIAWILCVGCIVITSGCADRSRNNKTLNSIQGLDLVSEAGIRFEEAGADELSGTSVKFAYAKRWGDIVSISGAELSPDVLGRMTNNIEKLLKSQGCAKVKSSIWPSGGLSSVRHATVDYSLEGSEARINVWIMPGGNDIKGRKILGHLILSVNEAR
jgi:hypothetical protein